MKRSKDKYERMDYAVDIPNSNDPENSWVNLDYFSSKKEALAYVQKTFGADSQGRICLVTHVPE